VSLAAAVLSAQQVLDPVSLDVVVDERTASRQPLTQSDFTVLDAGQPLQVQSARLVTVSSDTAPLPEITDANEAAVAASASRLVGVFMDDYHLEDNPAFASARTAVASFIRSAMGPRDLLLVVKPLDSLVSLRLTADREAAARMVEGVQPRQGDYTPRSSFEQEFIAGSPARIDSARNQIALSAVNAIITHLGRFDAGRKTLLVVSNGIAPRVPSRGEAPLPGIDSIVRTATRARVAVYLARPSPAVRADAPAQAPASVQKQPAAPRDPLSTAVEQTTGFVIDGPESLSRGLERMLHDASRYYVLTVTPPAGAADGRFRSVNVSVRRQGAVLRARAGYTVRRDDEEPRLRTTTLPPGLKIPRHSSPLIHTWFGQVMGGDGASAVSFVWEPSPRMPGERAVVTTPARVSMTVSTMDGAEIFSGASGPSGHDANLVPDSSAQIVFNLKPGTFLVQMDVLDAAGRVLDRDVRDLNVPTFRGPIALGTAAVFRTRSAREFRAVADGSANAAPVASRQFSRAEHIVVRIPVMSPDAEPTVGVRLQSRVGGPLRDLAISPAPGSQNLWQVDLPLASFASGTYMLEFTARNSLGSAIDRVEFTVTP